MKENGIEEDITRIKQRIEDVKEYIEYGLPYSEYLDLENSFDNILSDYKRVLKENEELKEYIAIAPNLDEMTATKYRNIQQDAYIQGRAEEQQKAEQIIYENYIPIQKVKDKIEYLDNQQKQWIEDRELKESDSEIIFARDILKELLGKE